MSCWFNLPSDYEILKAIYDMYYDEFCDFERGGEQRLAKNFIPLDVARVARDLNVDPDIVHGRLYYYLNEKYSYERKDGSKVELFILGFAADKRRHINFPLMASVLAGLHETNKKQNLTIGIAAFSLLVSLVSAVFSYMSIGS